MSPHTGIYGLLEDYNKELTLSNTQLIKETMSFLKVDKITYSKLIQNLFKKTLNLSKFRNKWQPFVDFFLCIHPHTVPPF